MKSTPDLHSDDTGETPAEGAALTRTVGLLSLARALPELVAPRRTAAVLGLRPSVLTSTLLRVHGVAGIATGASILLQPRRPVPLWARVVADAADFGLVAALAVFGTKTNGTRATLALAGLAGIAALDTAAAVQITKLDDAAQAPIMFSVTVNRPVVEVFQYIRDLSHLDAFMATPISPDRVDIVDEREGELIVFRSRPDAPIPFDGRVTFTKAPGRPSTEVRVELTVARSRLLAKVVAKPQIKEDLRRLKQIMETGEVLLSDASRHHGMHPAQPSDEPLEHAPHLERGLTGSGRPKRNSSRTGARDGGPTPTAARPNMPNGASWTSSRSDRS
jgi:uncharacterized membrane protein